ncbi:MAG: TVP38/TMEM64 family protein [Deltaproteobacteria bacterium]|nr:TVP38/TMEM64 family protein [Deltaproteobacteria bacterium]
MPNRNGNFIKLVGFSIILLTIIILTRLTGLDRYLDKDLFQTGVKGFGMWGPLVYILIYSITPSLFLPGIPVTIAGGLAFGPFYGTIYAIIGATIGASIAFLIARYFARGFVENLLKGRFKTIDEEVEKKGWLFVAITRLIPVFPFNLLNYAFGLTKIRFSHYVIASFIFMLPATAAYVVFSSSIFDVLKGKVSREMVIGIILITVISIIPVLYKRRKHGKI